MKEKSLTKGELYESRFGFRERNSNFCFLLVVVLILCSFFIVRYHFVSHYGGIVVSGSSMRETLHNGDKLFMRFTDEEHKADRGDVIVVYVGDYPECSDVKGGYLIKRLIAKENDRVKCVNGRISVWYSGGTGWEPLEEDYAYYGEGNAYQTQYDFAEYTVGEGEIFFLGDNRSSAGSSKDSRYLEGKSHLTGLYKETDIVGYVPKWSLYNKWLGDIFLSDEIA
ncbi:MAG: signal peptidase I [Clostridia bacterium]|nr:signal peptidase I [Clostridia bacterium]